MPGQLRPALARLLNALQAIGKLVELATLQIATHEAGAGKNDGEQVIEVVSDARRELPDRFKALHLLQRSLDPLTLADLVTQALVGGCELIDHLALASDVTHRCIHQAFIGHHGPGKPAVITFGVAHAIDETAGDITFGDAVHLGHGGSEVIGMQQLKHAVVQQLLAGPAQGDFPRRVGRDRQQLEIHDRQQLAGQLPCAVALTSALLYTVAKQFIEAFQGLGILPALADILDDPGKPDALAPHEVGAAVA